MLEPRTKDALSKVGICSDRVVLGVQGAEELPENETGVTCDSAHYVNIFIFYSAARFNPLEIENNVLTTYRMTPGTYPT